MCSHLCSGWWQPGKILCYCLHSEELRFKSFSMLSVNNIFLSTFLPRDHIHTLCKSITAGYLCSLPCRHTTKQQREAFVCISSFALQSFQKHPEIIILFFSFLFSSINTTTVCVGQWHSMTLKGRK